jgi:hypothetical protein
MRWTGGPRAWTLIDGGVFTVAQVTLDDDGRYHVYNYYSDGGEVNSGGGQGTTLDLAKRTAENVARTIAQKEQSQVAKS